MKSKNYILTGTPGSGKTTIIRNLEVDGYYVINEAATDIIALEQANGIEAPWSNIKFVEKVLTLQKLREQYASQISTPIKFYDRSPICTYALCLLLDYSIPKSLLQEIERITADKIYQKKVFFLENIGYIKETEARKISFEEAIRFESLHIESYTKFGYHCLKIPPCSIAERLRMIKDNL